MSFFPFKRKVIKYMAKSFKPGEKSKQSGQYGIISPTGRNTGKERTVVKGEPFPPTLKKGQHYELVDPTKTK